MTPAARIAKAALDSGMVTTAWMPEAEFENHFRDGGSMHGFVEWAKARNEDGLEVFAGWLERERRYVTFGKYPGTHRIVYSDLDQCWSASHEDPYVG